jgi:Ni/Co efflux regulator RcnB
MRKSLFFILLATAAMPALAAAPDENGRGFFHGTRAERSQGSGSENSQQPAAQNQRSEQRAVRAEHSERGSRPERTQQIVQSSDQPQGRSSNGFSGRRNRPDNGAQSEPAVRRGSNDGVTNWRSRSRYSGGTTSPTVPTAPPPADSRYSGDRSGSTNWRDRTRDGRTSSTTSPLSNWRDGSHDDHTRRWTSNWRSDHRYDWRNHRNHYSSLYRLGHYSDPFGYGYRRFSIGLFLNSGYYGNNYLLNDPWQYRLPPAYGPYRWIRYYDDALLVDTYSGEVVDVIYGFFW